MPGIEPQEFLFLLPEMFLAAVGMALLVAGSIGKGVSHRVVEGLSLAGLGLTAVLALWIKGQAVSCDYIPVNSTLSRFSRCLEYSFHL